MNRFSLLDEPDCCSGSESFIDSTLAHDLATGEALTCLLALSARWRSLSMYHYVRASPTEMESGSPSLFLACASQRRLQQNSQKARFFMLLLNLYMCNSSAFKKKKTATHSSTFEDVQLFCLLKKRLCCTFIDVTGFWKGRAGFIFC